MGVVVVALFCCPGHPDANFRRSTPLVTICYKMSPAGK